MDGDLRWTVTLPYRRPPLSLNDRGQTIGARKRKAATVKRVRADVKALAMGIPAQAAIHVRLHYQPYDSRRRDSDNLVATLKPCIDGLVDAGIVPDDCAPYVDWSRPLIHSPALDRVERLWLVITPATPPQEALL
jgi:crossover junction endodeoxyribonuclease RusA